MLRLRRCCSAPLTATADWPRWAAPDPTHRGAGRARSPGCHRLRSRPSPRRRWCVSRESRSANGGIHRSTPRAGDQRVCVPSGPSRRRHPAERLGVELVRVGRAGEALPLQIRALAITEAVYGPDHPDVALRLGNLTESLQALGRADEALVLKTQALAITAAVYGEDRPDFAVGLGNLALSLYALRRPAEALALEEQALAITRPGPPSQSSWATWPRACMSLGGRQRHCRWRSGPWRSPRPYTAWITPTSPPCTPAAASPRDPTVVAAYGSSLINVASFARSSPCMPLSSLR